MGQRIDDLVARLRKGAGKTAGILSSLRDDQWQMALYSEPHLWTARDLAAHLLSAEEGMLRIMQDIMAGGPGAPEGFDYDEYNATEQVRLAALPTHQLLSNLATAREVTLAWLAGLDDADLDRLGRHPALGVINLATFVLAIYGHQLMHMRDLQRLLAQEW
jgi:hypothetical protein